MHLVERILCREVRHYPPKGVVLRSGVKYFFVNMTSRFSLEMAEYVGDSSNGSNHHHHHHHHIVPLARISLTLSLHFSLSFIDSSKSSGLHPVSSHSCCMYVRAGRPAFDLPYLGVHRSTLFMCSSLLLQPCPACLVRLAWIVFVMGGRWPYSWCFEGCCFQDLINIARSTLV